MSDALRRNRSLPLLTAVWGVTLGMTLVIPTGTHAAPLGVGFRLGVVRPDGLLAARANEGMFVGGRVERYATRASVGAGLDLHAFRVRNPPTSLITSDFDTSVRVFSADIHSRVYFSDAHRFVSVDVGAYRHTVSEKRPDVEASVTQWSIGVGAGVGMCWRSRATSLVLLGDVLLETERSYMVRLAVEHLFRL